MNRVASIFFIGFFVCSCQMGAKRKKLSENHHQIAVSLIKECDYRRALTHLRKGIKIKSNDALIRHTLAVVYFLLKDYSSSARELKKVLKKRPDITEARVNLSRAYLELGEVKKSLSEIKKAEKDQTYSYPLKIVAQRGFAFFKKGEFLKSRKYFYELYSIPRARDCRTLLHLGRIDLKLNQLDQSEKFLKESLRVCSEENKTPICHGKSYDTYYFLAQVYNKKKQKKKSRYYLNLFIKRSSKDSPYFLEAQNLLKSLS